MNNIQSTRALKIYKSVSVSYWTFAWIIAMVDLGGAKYEDQKSWNNAVIYAVLDTITSLACLASLFDYKIPYLPASAFFFTHTTIVALLGFFWFAQYTGKDIFSFISAGKFNSIPLIWKLILIDLYLTVAFWISMLLYALYCRFQKRWMLYKIKNFPRTDQPEPPQEHPYIETVPQKDDGSRVIMNIETPDFDELFGEFKQSSIISAFSESYLGPILAPPQISCAICIESPSSRKLYSSRSCGHTFHKECIKKWCTVSDLCPICKQEFRIDPYPSMLSLPSESNPEKSESSPPHS